MGYESLKDNTTGIENTAIGHDALTNNTIGGANVAIGRSALAANTTGSLNTAIGKSALLSNTTGEWNTAIGTGAMSGGTGTNCNVAVGFGALHVNGGGDDNVAIGTRALRQNTTGCQNVAVGFCAMYTNTSGKWNTAIGFHSMKNNTIGSCNVAAGYKSLYLNTTGVDNMAVGYNSMYANTTGINNVALGKNTLTANVSGINNMAIGAYALSGNKADENTALGSTSLESNTTGTENVSIGAFSMRCNTTGNCNTAIGTRALYLNTIGIMNTAIGTCALYANTTGTCNTAIGVCALEDNTTGRSNTAVGFTALCNNTTGTNNTAVGVRAGLLNLYGHKNTSVGESALQNNTVGGQNIAIGYQALATNAGGSSNVAIGTCALITSLNNGNVAIGKNAGRNQGTQAAKYNIYLGYEAGCNLTTGAGNVIIGTIQPESNTANRQLKIAGYDGTDTTTWITGDLSGNVGIGTDSVTGGTARTLQISHDGSARLLLENTGGGRKYGFFAGTDGKLGLFDYTGSTQRLAIDTSGNFGIGTTTPDVTLDILPSAANRGIKIRRHNASGQYIHISETDGSRHLIEAIGNKELRIFNESDSHGTTFFTNSTERVRIHPGGVMSAVNGIALGVGTANTASNVLDDYEEGTFTPGYGGTTGSTGSLAYNTQTGRYTKVGNKVFATGEIRLSNKGSFTGVVRVSGLPFAPLSGAVEKNLGSIVLGNVDFATGVVGFNGILASGSNFYINKTTDNAVEAELNTSNVTNTSNFYFNFTYTTA
jgi:hypothetical protein